MPKQIFYSPAAGGKSTYALHLAHQAAISFQEVRICVPTSLQAHAWRQQLAKTGKALGVHVFTFDRLVAACLNAAGEAYTELSDPVQYRLLRAVIDQLPLEHYAPLKAKPGFIQICQHLITELKSALIMPADFATAVSQLDTTPRLRELAAIYNSYQQQLRAEGWADRVGLHWLAVESLRERATNACRDWPMLIVDGFDDFTPSQLELINLLSQRVDSCVFMLIQASVANPPRYQRTIQAVTAALGVTPQPLPSTESTDASKEASTEAPPSVRHPALSHLAQQIFAPHGQNGKSLNGSSVVAMYEATNRSTEARAALRWLKQRIVWDKTSPDQLALLAREITPYRPFIQEAAAEFGLPIRLVDGQPLKQSPVIVALLALLRLHLPQGNLGTPSLPRRQVIAAWRSPYFHWGSGDNRITQADADHLDSLARQHLVIRGLEQWLAAFAAGGGTATTGTDDEEGLATSAYLSALLVQQMAQKFNHFMTISQPPTTAATMRDFVQWLETLIGLDPLFPGDLQQPAGSLQIVVQARHNSSTATTDVAALRTLKDILRGLVWAEASVGPDRPVDYALFFNELVGAINATHYYDPPQPGQVEILVASVAQVRGLSFAAVAVMGLSEGSFPATIGEDPFLREGDREALRQQAAFALRPSTESAELEFFYEAVTRARQQLLFTRPILADNGAEWVASPYWEMACRLLDIVPISASSMAVLSPGEAASWVEWWESVAARPDLAGLPVDGAVQQHVETAATIWQIRQKRQTAVWEGDLSSMATALSARFGPSHTWSASRLEAYRTCGYFFFLQNLLSIAPRLEPAEGLDGRQLGSLYHDIFEQTSAAGLPNPPTETAVREQVIAVATPILDAAPAQQGFHQTRWWEQTRAEIIENVTHSLIALAEGDYTFFQAEVSFGQNGPPLVLALGRDQLQLGGFIDRIDRHANGTIRIIDYKSGSKTAFNAAAFETGKKLQLPLYALAAQEVLGLGQVSDGFYWHFQQAEPSSFQLKKAKGGIDGVMETAVTHAWEAVTGIRRGRFMPVPPTGGCPSYCPAAAFCWQYSPQSW